MRTSRLVAFAALLLAAHEAAARWLLAWRGRPGYASLPSTVRPVLRVASCGQPCTG